MPRSVVAGRCGAVERRHFFSAVGGMGQPRIRRAAVYFLSAAVVDAGGGAELRGSVECRAGGIHRAGADDGGTLFVCAGTAISAVPGGAFWSGVLHGEPVCAPDYFHAK